MSVKNRDGLNSVLKIGSYAVDLAVPDNGEQFSLPMIVQEVPAQDYRYICGLDGQGTV